MKEPVQLELEFAFPERGKRQRQIYRCLGCPPTPPLRAVWVVEGWEQVKFCAPDCAARALALVGLIPAAEHFSHAHGQVDGERYLIAKAPKKRYAAKYS